jgi:hypothetical protein
MVVEHLQVVLLDDGVHLLLQHEVPLSRLPLSAPVRRSLTGDCAFLSVLRIWIRKYPHHFARSGSGISEADQDPYSDPDPRLQNWQLTNFFSKKVEKYCE